MISALPCYYCIEYLNHDTGGHPENAGRLTAIINAIDKDIVTGKVELRDPNLAKKEDILLNHDESYFEFVKAEVESLGCFSSKHLDPDTIISPGSFIAAMKAAGAGLDMLKNFYGESDEDAREYRAIALPRPPGHHALNTRAMGFCLFNNIAIVAHAAIKYYGLKRVAIMDWDVHHGNGTEDSFYDNPDVLYISTHQYPAYPGTGAPQDIGTGKGAGFNVNLPLAPVSGDSEIAFCFEQVVMPVLEQYDPQLLLISAGYDAHERDPLASLTFSTNAFEWMAARLENFSFERKIPMFAFLEGGYDFIALAAGVIQTMNIMRGEESSVTLDSSKVSGIVKHAVQETKSALKNKWTF